MKRTKLDHKLRLDRTIIRTLETTKLREVAGGALPTSMKISCTGCAGDDN